MAPALTDGVPGLEAIHTLTPPSPFSAFALNDWMSTTTGKTVQWAERTSYTWVKGIEGIHDAPDMDDPRVKLNYQSGELPLPRFGRGRTITYSGILAAQTLAELNAKRAALVATIMSGLVNPTAWLISVAYNTTYDSTGLAFAAYGVPVGFTCPAYVPNGDLSPVFQSAFQLSFRQSDGKWWVTPTAFLCTLGSAGDVMSAGGTGTLTLTGTAPSEPTFTVVGSGAGLSTITLTATEVGGELTIDLPAAMSSGDKLVVNFGQRSIKYTPSGGAATDYSGYLDWTNSNWWNEADVPATLLVGDNTLSVVGDTWYATAMPATW
jgi:hypothetical protein